MTYRIIQPPFSLQFSTMSKPELRAYYAWFMEVLPERVAELEPAVRATEAHDAWRADYTRDSLSPLGQWFWGQVETRPRSRNEMDAIQSRLPYPVELPGYDLTDRTLSLAMDLGMYMGKVLASTTPGAAWEQPLEDENAGDYGQPVVVGLGPMPVTPVRIMVMLAYRIASKKRSVDSLRELYGIWRGMKRASASP